MEITWFNEKPKDCIVTLAAGNLTLTGGDLYVGGASNLVGDVTLDNNIDVIVLVNWVLPK